MSAISQNPEGQQDYLYGQDQTLAPLVEQVERVAREQRQFPVLRWAIVESVSPLHIRLEEDAAIFLGTVSTLVHPSLLAEGMKVEIALQMAKATIQGIAGGSSNIAATQSEVNAGINSSKFVTAKTLNERPYFIANLNSGKFSGGYGWKVFGTVGDWAVEQKGFGASSAVWWASGVKIPVAGVYLLTGTILINASGLLIVGLKKNNSSADGTAMLVSGQEAGFAGWTSASFATEVRLAAGDLLSFATFTDADYGITDSHTRFGVDFMHA